MNIKVAIIGAGWYGCHLASSLKDKGFSIKLFEKNSDIFSEASSNNQNRLHLGFHYPRSALTRAQSSRGFKFFKLFYPQFIRSIDINIYSIAQYNSLIDFETYKQIMEYSKLKFEDISSCTPVILKNIEGSIYCEEMLINASKIKKYFSENLKNNIELNSKIDCNKLMEIEKNFDFIIDCSWNKVFTEDKFFYEPSIIFKYEKNNSLDLALTIMDGKLCSIYPYGENSITLSDVEYTPLGNFETSEDAYKTINQISQKQIDIINKKMEEKISYYYPSFKNNYINPIPIFSIKTKSKDNLADHRYSFIKKVNEKTYSVFSGKIDTIFDIEFQILSIISNKLNNE